MTSKKSWIGIVGFVFGSLAGYAQEQSPRFVVAPYIQHATQTGITVLWETNKMASSQVEFGEALMNVDKANLSQRKSQPGVRTMHEVELTGLKPETNYFYRVRSVTEGGDTLYSAVTPFQTAVHDSSAYSFVVFSDSQSNPGTWGRITELARQERPNFALHGGDLVGYGYLKNEWVDEFFAPSNHFMKQIPMYTIPGNHEHDAAYYYQYFANPAPEYYYSFKYGNAEFFMVDTNHEQDQSTEMYSWLEHALARSTATWKFVVHHHPPYSSDEDDFGDTNKEASIFGDEESRELVPLYEKYGVDIVFFGHIHTYERTWPIFQNKVRENNGVIYLTLGGAGGGLEKAAPIRSWFSRKVKTTHHFASVSISGNTLEYQAIDDKGAVFDQFVLTESRKRKISPAVTPAAPAVSGIRRIFVDNDTVKLVPALPDDQLYYTLDGSEPGRNSPRYKNGILLSESSELKTVAFNKSGKSRVKRDLFTKVPLHSAVEVANPQPGLRYDHLAGKLVKEEDDLVSSLKFVKSGTVPGLDLDAFSHSYQHWGAIYSGFIRVPADGYYRFYGHADNVFKFYIHNKLLIEEYNREIDREGEIYLKAGLHPVKIEYYNNRDLYFMRFEYSGPGIARRPVGDELWFYSK